jgi:hypothetical protein
VQQYNAWLFAYPTEPTVQFASDLTTPNWRVRQLLQAAHASLACPDRASFYRSLQKQVELAQEMLAQTQERRDVETALDEALGATRDRPRLHRILELSLVPLYDKPLLPGTDGVREFLWLFAIPVHVTFSQNALAATPLELPASLFDVVPVLHALRASDCLRLDGPLRMFSGLWQREELLCLGPQTWARAFVHNELYDEPVAPARAGLLLHPDFPLNRTRNFYVLAAMRCPSGSAALFSHGQDESFRTSVAATVSEGLVSAGVGFDAVQAFEAGSFAVAYLTGERSWQSALLANLQDARANGATGVGVQFPSPDHVEVYVWDEQERRALLAPASLIVEPKPEVAQTVASVAQAAGLQWCGSSSSLHNTTPLLH